jgi:hypothetical protein
MPRSFLESGTIIDVDPRHPDARDDSDLTTPFITIQGAIDAIGPLPIAGQDHVVKIAPGVYNETVTINYSKIHLMGYGFGTTIIQPSVGDALTYRPISATVGPWDNRIHDILIDASNSGGDAVVVSGETAPLSGVFYDSMCGNELLIVDSTILGDMRYDHANYLSAQGIFVAGTVFFTQCAGQWWNFSEIAGTLNLSWNPADPNPTADPSNYGWSPYDGVVSTISLLAVQGKIDARKHGIGTLNLNAAGTQADMIGCYVGTLNNPGGGTINSIGDFYDNTVQSILTAANFQAAIDELAYRNNALSGVINPNGVVTGEYPQTYLDTATSTLYMSTDPPGVPGTTWSAI